MKTYKIYKHPTLDFLVAVKEGFSWPAFFFSLFWMTNMRLWTQAALYLLAGIVLARIDDLVNTINSNVLDISMLFPLVAFLVIPGFMGNKWRVTKLPKLGYEYISSVQAKTCKAAIALVQQGLNL